MHEMGIALEVVRIAQASIPDDCIRPKVERILLKVGKLAAVVPDSLQFCFQVATRDTPLDGAELVIEQVPVRLRCRGCTTNWEADEPVFICPSCQGTDIEMISGRELDIEAIEIVDNEEDRGA